MFNWKDPAICQDNCIDPERNVEPPPANSSSSQSAAGLFLLPNQEIVSIVVLGVSFFLYGVMTMVTW